MTTSDSVLTGPRPTSVPSVGPVVAELEDEITVTVMHEVGHFFGISEERLHELGWG